MDKCNSEGYPDPTAYEALTNIETEMRKGKFMPLVYICSPYSGNVPINKANARRYCRFAIDSGFIPLAPHLLFPQFMDDDNERDQAMFMNVVLLSKCTELWVFGEFISKGMAIEIGRAKRKGQPIRSFTEDCEEVL